MELTVDQLRELKAERAGFKLVRFNKEEDESMPDFAKRMSEIPDAFAVIVHESGKADIYYDQRKHESD